MRAAATQIEFLRARALALDGVGETAGGEFEQGGLHVDRIDRFTQTVQGGVQPVQIELFASRAFGGRGDQIGMLHQSRQQGGMDGPACRPGAIAVVMGAVMAPDPGVQQHIAGAGVPPADGAVYR